MKGAKREITDREREQLRRWLRSAATSGEGMPTLASICARFRCGLNMAKAMLLEQRDAGVIALRQTGGGTRPVAQPVRNGNGRR